MHTTHQHEVATCRLCKEPILVPCTDTPQQMMALAQYATEHHIAQHPSRERARFVLSNLETLPPPLRLTALKQAYAGLDEEDQRGVYSIEEALGDASLYRLWLDANRCGGPHCSSRR